VLTFRLEAPVTINTTTAPQAFHWVQPGEYDHPAPSLIRREPRPQVVYAPGPVWGPYAYPYYDPFWYGPSLGFYFGRGYGYHRGYYRHWR
jgi:hypothetical protein